jgi:hypothetical protein
MISKIPPSVHPWAAATTDENGAYTIDHVENGSYIAPVAGASGS